jgi:disulfide bond formation protein DsbB
MYPIAILSLVSILFRIHLRKAFVLALCVPGMLIALYQYALQLTAGGSDVNLCGGSVSCNFIDFKLLGFITIPLMSFLAFLLINLIVVGVYFLQKRSLKSETTISQG